MFSMFFSQRKPWRSKQRLQKDPHQWFKQLQRMVPLTSRWRTLATPPLCRETDLNLRFSRVHFSRSTSGSWKDFWCVSVSTLWHFAYLVWPWWPWCLSQHGRPPKASNSTQTPDNDTRWQQNCVQMCALITWGLVYHWKINAKADKCFLISVFLICRSSWAQAGLDLWKLW